MFQSATTAVASDAVAYAQPAVLGDAPVLPDAVPRVLYGAPVPAMASYSAVASGAGVLGDGGGAGLAVVVSVSAAAPFTSLVPEGLDVPLQAPRLRVPADLPLEQSTLLDLLACAVVQGGPTTEEEVVRREVGRRHNPAFAFLGEKFNHPCLLYYRWRLYSLLQGDTLLSWRTQPFQMEGGRLAYAWVPPPPLRAGPESLAGLHRSELMSASRASAAVAGGGSGAGAGDAVGGEEDGADAIVRTVRRRRHRHRKHSRGNAAEKGEGAADVRAAQSEVPHDLKRPRHEADIKLGVEETRGNEEAPSAQLRRGGSSSRSSSSSSGSESRVTTSSDDSSDVEDDAKGSEEEQGEVARRREGSGGGAADAQSAGGRTTPSMSSSSPQPSQGATTASSSQPARADAAAAAVGPVPLPPPSAQWISRQCTEHRHVFAVLRPELLSEWTALLNPYAIADPASLSAGTTLTSTTSPSPAECVNVVAELSARWLRRDEVATRMAFAIRYGEAMHHLLSMLLDAVVRVAYVATAQSRQPPMPSAGTGDAAVLDSNVYCVEALWYLFVLHDIVMNAANIPDASSSSAAVAPTTPTTTSSSSSSSNSSAVMPVCVNRNPPGGAHFSRQSQQASTSSAGMLGGFGGSPDVEDDAFATSDISSPETLEALYDALRHHQHATPNSAGSAMSQASSSAAAAPTPPSPAGPLRPRRRQRNPQRRSAYERCGDALEAILPTLMEACVAIALAVSMDKERLRSQAPPPAAPTDKSAAAARVRHFKVLPALSPQQLALQATARQRTSDRTKAKLKQVSADPDVASASAAADAAVAAALLAGTGGPCLSLKLDAGCDPSAAVTTPNTSGSSSTATTPQLPTRDASPSPASDAAKAADTGSDAVASAAAATAPSPPLPSSAPAVLLLDWLKTLVVVWMEAEQPLQLPPSAPVWPRFAETELADLQEVKLTHHVEAAHAGLLGLVDASGPTSGRDAYPQPPLLSARGCAVLKERYPFLF